MAKRIIPPYLQAIDNPLLKSSFDKTMYERLLSIICNLNDAHTTHTIKKDSQLVEWIIQMTPALQDSSQFKYELQTRCRWILSGRNSFPKCQFCGKEYGMNKFQPIRYEYSKWCSNKCRQSDPIVVARTKATKLRNHGDPHYCNPKKIAQTSMKHFGVSNPNKCRAVREKIENTNLKNYGHKCVMSAQRVKDKVRQTCLDNYGYPCSLMVPSVIEKCIKTWIYNYGVDHPMKSDIGKKKVRDGFMRRYGVDHNMKSPIGYAEYQQGVIKKYGVTHISHVPEIQIKQHRKYLYDGIYFDSAPEIAFYIWLVDNNIAFEYHPKLGLSYLVDGKQHVYFADFILPNGVMVEIKGDQFFDKDGNLCCPYHNKDNKMTNVYKAKWQCMLDNNVVVLKSKEYRFFLDYVSQKYGKDYLASFRVNKSKKF